MVQNEKSSEVAMRSSIQDKLAFVAYSLPYSAVVMLISPVVVIIPGMYAKYFGLELTTIAFVLLVARLFDVLIEPVVAWSSDYMYTHQGSRKPMVILGGILTIISGWFLFTPPEHVSATYFLVWYILFYLSWTVFDTPHIAWGAEIATDYKERSRLYGFRSIFESSGRLVFYSLPFWPWFATHEFNPSTLNVAILIAAIVMLVGLALMFFYAPKTVCPTERKKDNVRDIVQSIVKNGPLIICVMVYLVSAVGMGMHSALLFIYLDSYLTLASSVAVIMVTGIAARLLGIPIWLRIIHRTDKKVSWVISMSAYATIMLGFVFVKPSGGIWLPLILQSGLYFVYACQDIVVPSILGDAADYGAWKFRKDRTAVYFTFLSLSGKLGVGVGAASGLLVAGFFGFDPAVTSHSEEAVYGLKIAFFVLPAIFTLLSVFFIFLIRINQKSHSIIRKRIERQGIKKSSGPE